MREIRAKIEKIEQEAGEGLKGDALKSLEDELDDDWDPARHDAKMMQLYNEEGFYAVEVGRILFGCIYSRLARTTKSLIGQTILTLPISLVRKTNQKKSQRRKGSARRTRIPMTMVMAP